MSRLVGLGLVLVSLMIPASGSGQDAMKIRERLGIHVEEPCPAELARLREELLRLKGGR